MVDESGPVPTFDIEPDDNPLDHSGEPLPGPTMSLGQHIEELRWRLLIVVLVCIVFFFGAAIFYQNVWELLMLPFHWTSAQMDRDVLDLVRLQAIKPMSKFFTVMGITLYLSVLLSLPVIIVQIWNFVSPGLNPRERKAIATIFSAGSVLFLSGVAVAFRFAIPLGLRFLIAFNQTLEGVDDKWEVGEYLSFLTMSCLGFGIAFETPLVMMALAWMGIITPQGILKYWRHALLAIFVIGAVLTPPDPFTQVMLASILAILYFSGYLLACWIAPKEDA